MSTATVGDTDERSVPGDERGTRAKPEARGRVTVDGSHGQETDLPGPTGTPLNPMGLPTLCPRWASSRVRRSDGMDTRGRG